MATIGHHGLFVLVLWPIIAAFMSYLIGRKHKQGRDLFIIFAAVLEFIMTVVVAFTASNEHPHEFVLTGFMGYRIDLTMDGLRCIYALITAFMWMMTSLFSKEYFAHYHNRNRYYFFMLLTLGGTMGVFLSADLVTTFLFFEIMSFTSYVMVIHDEKPAAIEASKTYMAMAVIGGLSMIFGIFIVNDQLGTTEIAAFYDAMHHFEGNKNMIYLAAAFMLVGFGGKAGIYPLHIWLPTAHPAAPAPASALLSGVLTKTGVYGIIIMSALLFPHDFGWGMVILVIGVVGMFTGALLALFSIDLKRTLACSSVSQIGFIMVGVGMMGILGEHNALAVRGTFLHMVNHSLIKLVLFMAAGVVYVNLHQLDLNKVRGFGRGKPLFTFCFLMGVLGIIGLPFWDGYISKTLLHESIVEEIWLFADYTYGARFFQVVESIFTLTGGLTTAYMIKLFMCVCVEKNEFDQGKLTALNKKYLTVTSAAALLVSALFLPVLGFSPDTIMVPISKFGQEFMHGHDPEHAVHFYEWVNLKGAVASLSIGVIIYAFIVRGCLMEKNAEGKSVYVNLWPSFIDIEKRIYRPLLLTVLPFIGAFAARVFGSVVSGAAALGFRAFMAFRKFWIDAAAKETVFGVEHLQKDYEAFCRLLPKVDGEILQNAYANACRQMPRVDGEVLQNAYANACRQMPRIDDEVLQKQYERIRRKAPDFMNLLPGGEASSKRFELFKPIAGSLAYSLLLFLTGVVVVAVFVFSRYLP